MTADPIRLEDISVDDVDVSDLEAKYAVEANFSMDNYVVVSGAPVIPENKVNVLEKALTGLFSKAGKVVRMEFPLDDDTKKTKGFIFVECSSAADANKIIKVFHGKRLDLKHRLFLYSMQDVERIGSVEESPSFEEPKMPALVSSSELKSWLLDERNRDQYVLQKETWTSIFWNGTTGDDEIAVEPRNNWSTNYVRFSPKGTYLFSYHPQGVTCWGGPNFDKLRRFYHPDAKTSIVSPNDKYLVTLSQTPIKEEPRIPESQFTKKNVGHYLCVWDIETELLVTTFDIIKSEYLVWPFVRFSYDDNYCARMVGDTLVVYDCEKGFTPIDSKNLRVPGIRDFSFAPAGVQLQTAKPGDKPLVVLAYWTPETNNAACAGNLVDVRSGKLLKAVNLVQVSNVTIHWQNNAEFVCFNAERHSKTGKTLFSNLEICKLNGKDVVVEKIDLKDRVFAVDFEPNGCRFVTIGVSEDADDNIAIPSNVVRFFAPEKKETLKVEVPKGKNQVRKWTMFKEIRDMFSNTISWSPAGRFVVVAALVRPDQRKGELEFFDFDFASEKNMNDTPEVAASLRSLVKQTYGGVTDLTWDPSGRYLAAWSSSIKHKIDNGYKIYNVAGELLKEAQVNDLRNFAWRPRPASRLTNADRKRIRKNLRDWSAQFEEQDAMENDTALRDQILRQRRLMKEWAEYRAEVEQRIKNHGLKTFNTLPVSENAEFVEVEEIQEELIEETKEKV